MGESGIRLPGGKSLGSHIFAIAATVVAIQSSGGCRTQCPPSTSRDLEG